MIPILQRSDQSLEPDSCSVQSLSHVRLFATPGTAACQASLSITSSRRLLKLMSIKSVMPSNHLILCRPLLLLPSVFPSTRVFSNESVLINTQHKRSKRSLSTCIFLPVDVHWSQRCLWERPSFVPRLCTWANPCLHV